MKKEGRGGGSGTMVEWIAKRLSSLIPPMKRQSLVLHLLSRNCAGDLLWPGPCGRSLWASASGHLECLFRCLLPALGTGFFTSALCQSAGRMWETCSTDLGSTADREHETSPTVIYSLPKERGHGGQKNHAPKPWTCARLQLYEQQTLGIFSHWVLGLCFMQHWLQTR